MNYKKILFKDIIGYDAEKAELQEIISYFNNKDQYEKIGARISKGILLVGEPGNGKTMMINALSNEVNVPIYNFISEKDDDKNVNNIRKLFEEAKSNSPCLIIIEEIDKLEEQESFFGGPSEQSITTRELLVQMDGFNENEDIIVIASANSERNLSRALLRSGRFDKRIIMKEPSLDERRELFKHYSRNRKLEKDVNFDELAKRTSGINCADVENIINEAALLSVRNKKENISMEDIETSIDRVLLKSASLINLNTSDKDVVSIHETGHAIVAIALGKGNAISKISIIGRGQTGGFVRMSEDEQENIIFNKKSDIINNIIISLGGIAAENIFNKESSTGCHGDLNFAYFNINRMINNYGMYGIKNISTQNNGFSSESSSINSKRDKLLSEILNRCYKKACKLIKKNKNSFINIKNILLEKGTIYKEELDIILSNS